MLWGRLWMLAVDECSILCFYFAQCFHADKLDAWGVMVLSWNVIAIYYRYCYGHRADGVCRKDYPSLKYRVRCN
jgi:hypothetical protein